MIPAPEWIEKDLADRSLTVRTFQRLLYRLAEMFFVRNEFAPSSWPVQGRAMTLRESALTLRRLTMRQSFRRFVIRGTRVETATSARPGQGALVCLIRESV